MSAFSYAAMFLLVLLVATQPARAETFELPIQREAQYGDKMCWAATSTIAVQAVLPAGSTARAELLRETGLSIDQFTIAALGIGSVTKPGAGTGGLTARKAQVKSLAAGCRTNLSPCNRLLQPVLYGLTSKVAAWNAPLTAEQLRQEIVVSRRPVLLTLTRANPKNARRTTAKHELLIYGYRTTRSGVELKIWNPLPVKKPATPPQPAGAQHGSWKPYDSYVTPGSDYDVPFWRNGDRFGLEVAPVVVSGTQHPPMPLPPSHLAPPLVKVDFTTALQAFDQRKQALLAAYVARGVTDPAAPVSFAEPFPIVAPNVDELLEPGDPTRLLVERTSGLVVPVLQNGQVVDSFTLLYRDGDWKVQGFSNTAVDEVLVALRSRYPAPPPPAGERADSFYMVAIPEESAFFAAHGFGKKAMLLSVDEGGQAPAPAQKALHELVTRVEADLIPPKSSY